MKHLISLIAIALLISVGAQAQDQAAPAKDKAKKETTAKKPKMNVDAVKAKVDNAKAKGDHAKAKVEDAKAKVEGAEKTKLICPVTGEDADPEVSYAYQGTTYYFCCGSCVKKFKADPAKYIKNASGKKFDACDHPEGEKAAHEGEMKGHDHSKMDAAFNTPVINEGKNMAAQISNTVCPVMGEAIDKDVPTVSYKGKVYGFCCKPCVKKFVADPEKYLKKS